MMLDWIVLEVTHWYSHRALQSHLSEFRLDTVLH